MSLTGGNTGPVITATCTDATGIAAGKIVTQDATNSTNTSLAVVAATANTDFPLGVTTEATSAADDQPVKIQIAGIAAVVVDGSGTAIDNGTLIVATAAGVGVAAATASATSQKVLGVAMAPSAASGDVIPVLICQHTFVKGTA